MDVFREYILLVVNYIRLVWQHRNLVIVSSTVLCLIGSAGIIVLPNYYISSTKIFVDTESMLSRSLEGLVINDSAGGTDFVQVTRRTVLNRANIEKIIRAADLDVAVRSPKEQDLLIAEIAKDIEFDVETVNRNRESVVTLSFRHREPEVAYTVAQELLDIFTETILGSNRQDMNATEDFLDARIDEYRLRLESALARHSFV